MNTINELQDEVIEEFSTFTDWMDKYALLIEMGNALEPLEERFKTSDNLIEGCQSRVWLTADLGADGRITFRGDSDAVIVKGIVSLLIRVLSGHTPSEITASDLYFIDRIGLKEHLSPSEGGIAKGHPAFSFIFARRKKETTYITNDRTDTIIRHNEKPSSTSFYPSEVW